MSALRAAAGVAATALLVVACGGKPQDSEPTEMISAGSDSQAAPTPPPASASSASGSASVPPAATGGTGTYASRTGELVNPDDAAMVFLYYDLSGMKPPIENWVEKDRRVQYVPAVEKAPNRVAVKAELEAGAAAVRNVGLIRLSTNANLSEYDPTYGEFTVRALAPSSVIDFKAFDQKVSVKFANGRTAQIWKVPPAEAQAIRDKIQYVGNVSLDVALRIASVLPGPGGGTITTEVAEYEMRDQRSGATIARVQVPQK